MLLQFEAESPLAAHIAKHASRGLRVGPQLLQVPDDMPQMDLQFDELVPLVWHSPKQPTSPQAVSVPQIDSQFDVPVWSRAQFA